MIVLPMGSEPTALVDWLEASLLTGSPNRISDAAIGDVFAEYDWEDADGLLAAMHQVVRTRNRIVGNGYPIVKDGQGFARKGPWSAYLPYSFMLFASLNQNYVELNYKKGSANLPAELFEHLSAKAIENYLHCSVIRIGAPRRSPLPAAFPSALDHVTTKLGEAIGRRDLEKQSSGDDGVDLIGWKSFGDSRASQAIILAQCSIGTDWRDKRSGIDLKIWRRHIDWHSEPLVGFAVPFHHENGSPWRETATRGGVIFDRLRIAKLVPINSLPKANNTEMATWCASRIKQIKELDAEGQ